MATWVTHLMIADGVLQCLPHLDRRGFCVGNIAPDCNVENEDWTAFTPSREVTHWMQGERKKATDCDAFCEEYIIRRFADIDSNEQYSFLLGYYAHLITDAAFQAMIRNEDRVKAAWSRIKADAELYKSGAGMEETWDAIKKLVPKRERMRRIYVMEAEYLRDHPDSSYLTEILTLKAFPDYIDYLPTGAIARKIGVMGYLPKLDESVTKFITMSREEYAGFVNDTIRLVVEQFSEKRLLHNLQERYELAMKHERNWGRMDKISIRKAEPGDEKILAHIQTESWKAAFTDILSPEELERCTNLEKAEQMYHSVLRREGCNMAIEFAENQPHCIAAWGKNRCDLGDAVGELICIHSLQNNWAKGYGSAMMEYVLAQLQQEGYKSVILWVFEANTRARKFYEKHGFELTKQKKLANGIAELMYAKDI